MTNQKDIFSYLVPGKCAHLAGIGGVSMSPLAEVLHGMGLKVQGSDMNDGPSVEHLRSLGIPVAIGHAADNLGECDFVIRTAAIHDDNPEISGAVTRGIPVFERAQAWGAIMKGYKNALCISGTHGKTTTTSMATHIFMAAQKDPTVMIGGTLQLLHSGYRVGKGDTIIAESCEYCNSFLSFFPTVAVILNVEADHLDFFKDLADVEHSFRRFAELVPIGGHVVANMDDEGARDALRGISQPIFWFSYDDPAAQCRAENVVWTDGLPSFDIYIRGSYYAHVSLRVGGKHNVMNALAAASAAYLLGVSGEAVGLGLATFTGAGRRFEYKGSFHGADVYDDYAHHPGELHALLIEPSGDLGVILAHNLKEGVGHHRLADVLRFHGTVQNQRHRSGFSSITAPGKQAVSKPAHLACVVINPVRTFRSSAGGKAQHRVGGGNEFFIGELLLPPGQRYSGLRGGGTVLSSTGLRFAYAFRAALRFLFRETGALAGGVLRFLRCGGRFCGTACQQTECQHQGQESFHPIASFQSLFIVVRENARFIPGNYRSGGSFQSHQRSLSGSGSGVSA